MNLLKPLDKARALVGCGIAKINALPAGGQFSLAIGLFVVLALGRAWHHLFVVPYLYMEQATVYYKYAFEHGWPEALLAPHQGYYNFWINFVTAVAAKILPMEYAPYAMTFGGTVVGAVIAALVCAPGSPVKGFAFQLLALVLMVFVPPGEDRFSITYAHFYIAVAVALVVVSEAKSMAEVLWQRRVLVFAVCCGPVGIFVLPVFLLAYVQRREKEKLVQAGILAVGAVMQLLWLCYALGQGQDVSGIEGSRFRGWGELDVLVFWLYDRLLIYPFFGWWAFYQVGMLFMQPGVWHTLVLIIAMLGLVGWTGVAKGEKRNGVPVGVWLVISLLCISVGNFFCSVMVGDSKLYLITMSHRYFLAQAMIVGLVFVYQLSCSRTLWHQLLYAMLVAWMLVAGVMIWWQWSQAVQPPVAWAPEVQAWRANPHYGLRIMPLGHRVWLSGDGR